MACRSSSNRTGPARRDFILREWGGCDCRLGAAVWVRKPFFTLYLSARLASAGVIVVVRLRTLAVWLGVGLFGAAGGVAAQQPEGPAKPAGSSATSDRPAIRESGPPVMYLKNKDGQLIVVPSLTIEELEKLLQLDRGLSSRAPPRFAFTDTVQLSGTATDAAAEFQARMAIRLPGDAAPAGEWLRIPLRLPQAILTAPVQVEGGGELFTEYHGNGDGYVLWLRSTAKSEYRFTLQFKVPITTEHGEKRLLLVVPNRPASLKLTVGSAQAEGRVRDDAGSILSSPVRTSDGRTEFVLDGPGGELEFFWRDTQELPPVLQAEGSILVRLAGRSFDAEALLRVRSFGTPIDSFSVRLPPGVQWLGSSTAVQAGIQVSPASSPPGEGAVGKSGQLLVVRRLEGKTTNPIEVRLRAASTGVGTATGGTVDVSGFEVVGAQIQRGTVDFVQEGEWTVQWQIDANVRRVDVPDALRPQQVMARFEYDRQPFSLRAVVGRGVARVNVEPTYIITVEANQLKLDASLRYRISSARADKLLVDTGGWVIDRVGPAELLSGPWTVDKDQLEIPLAAGSAAGRSDFELQLAGHQPIEDLRVSWFVPFGSVFVPGFLSVAPATDQLLAAAGGMPAALREFRCTLPRPAATAATPCVVIVSPADNIELSPSTERLRWLVADTLPAQVKLPSRQQPPLVYREDAVGQRPEFAGVFKVRQQSIAAAIDSQIRVNEREWEVTQRFALQILFEPASQLAFDVPHALWSEGQLEVALDGNLVTTVAGDAPESADPDRQVVLVALRDSRLGPCEILFRYRGTHARTLVNNATSFAVPLVRPAEAAGLEVRTSTLRLTSPPPLRVSLVDEDLFPYEDEATGATEGQELVFPLEPIPHEVSVMAATTAAIGRRMTVIERVWVQTLLASSKRRDRACFRLNTNKPQLDFTLPRGADTDDVAVFVNGSRTDQYVWTNKGEIRVALGDAVDRQQVTVELWYWLQAQRSVLGRLQLQAPELAGASRPERTFWELRLPGNEHLAWASTQLASENIWRWRGLFLERHPQFSQGELEQWVRASHRRDERGLNAYLFSSVAGLGPVPVVTMARPLAVLLLAGGVFAAGVLLLYFPVLRHPLVMLAASCGLAATAAVFPEPTMAAAQVAALGLVLVGLTRLLMALLPRRTPPRSASRSGFILTDSRALKAAPRRGDSHVEAGAGATTPTVSAPFQMSVTGNEP